jgi:hypothetical protein
VLLLSSLGWESVLLLSSLGWESVLPLTFIDISSESEASWSSVTVSLKTNFESSESDGALKLDFASSESLISTLGPSVCSHLYETSLPSSSLLLLASSVTSVFAAAVWSSPELATGGYFELLHSL